MVDADFRFLPLVKGETTATSPNVSSVMDQLEDGTYYIPDYQRDSSQWDVPKKSLFIESLINNLTIPPLILYPEDDPVTATERRQIVDGQQRLTTIHDFLKDGFALSPESDVEYAENVGPIIQGLKFSELPKPICKQIERYTLNFIVLPKNLELHLRLEIFRRINEGGVPLSPQDLRLAMFSESDRVYLIRLAGIFDARRDGSIRMIQAAQTRFGLQYPWKNGSAWYAWWNDSAQSAGQTASQMFLYYVIARDLRGIGTLLASEKTHQNLGLRYNRTTVSVLDLYCAQMQYEMKPGAAKMLADLPTITRWFNDFENWFNVIKSAKVPRIPLNSSTKIAFFIAAAASEWNSPDRVTEPQWQLIQVFLTQGPGKIKEVLGMDYPIAKGKWPGQKNQIDQTFEICKKIASQ